MMILRTYLHCGGQRQLQILALTHEPKPGEDFRANATELVGQISAQAAQFLLRRELLSRRVVAIDEPRITFWGLEPTDRYKIYLLIPIGKKK